MKRASFLIFNSFEVRDTGFEINDTSLKIQVIVWKHTLQIYGTETLTDPKYVWE